MFLPGLQLCAGFGHHGAIPVDEFAFACVHSRRFGREHRIQPRFHVAKDTESYSAAKGGILALTHALSISLAGKARVNSISPGWIDTGSFHKDEDYHPAYEAADLLQHPVGRVGVPDDIVQTITSSAATQPAS